MAVKKIDSLWQFKWKRSKKWRICTWDTENDFYAFKLQKNYCIRKLVDQISISHQTSWIINENWQNETVQKLKIN